MESGCARFEVSGRLLRTMVKSQNIRHFLVCQRWTSATETPSMQNALNPYIQNPSRLRMKTMMKYHSISVRMAVTKKTARRRNRNPVYHWCKMVQPLWKTILWFLKKLNRIAIGYNSPTSKHIPKRIEGRDLNRYLYTSVHSSVIHSNKKVEAIQGLSADEWINKMWYVHTIECYSALEKKEILLQSTTWVNLEDLMLSGRSQAQKDKYCMVSLI